MNAKERSQIQRRKTNEFRCRTPCAVYRAPHNNKHLDKSFTEEQYNHKAI